MLLPARTLMSRTLPLLNTVLGAVLLALDSLLAKVGLLLLPSGLVLPQ